MPYDKNNIFAKILRGEIPCKKIFENEFVLSFYDINPQKKIHALIIPKGSYIDLDDFIKNAKEKEILGANNKEELAVLYQSLISLNVEAAKKKGRKASSGKNKQRIFAKKSKI